MATRLVNVTRPRDTAVNVQFCNHPNSPNRLTFALMRPTRRTYIDDRNRSDMLPGPMLRSLHAAT
ncbi:hypothetical protein GCM10011309_15250 [Litorimonas cladophorae]|uniref:Uncharacterized protein n=1 Tax=Litorimonas cladophorae TaxID=1220491 RepID=A0A918KLY0_9PROT|nr:hypothetical protein GCM10011309_15250 [Litorimonas cladophorae]